VLTDVVADVERDVDGVELTEEVAEVDLVLDSVLVIDELALDEAVVVAVVDGVVNLHSVKF
jgi:hypothetical protein